MLYNSFDFQDDSRETPFRLIRNRAPARPAHILLAHPQDLVRASLRSQARALGCRVESFADSGALLGRLADEILENGGPGDRLVLAVDARLKGCRGDRLLACLRRAGWTVPVILFSGSSGRYLGRLARRLGLACVFSLPCEVEDLVTAIYFLLDQAAVVSRRKQTAAPRVAAPLPVQPVANPTLPALQV